MGKIIAVVSGKGGVGKTTFVVNIGIALQQLGKKVCLVDTNVTTANLGLHFGITSYPITLNEILGSRLSLLGALFLHWSNVSIIPGSLSLEEISVKNMWKLRRKIKEVERYFDFVILDSAPGLEELARVAIKSADEIIIVTNPEITAITDALRVRKYAKRKKIPIKGVVINKVRNKKFEFKEKEIEKVLEAEILGTIPYDDSVLKALSNKIPLLLFKPNSSSAKAIKNIAARLLDKKVETTFEKLKSMFKNFLKL
jgi:septum site-determining protein MinD